MSTIIAVLNQKGGAGKTTLSTNLAFALQETNESVLLVDSDPQGSARDWHQASGGSVLKVMGIDRDTLDKDIKNVGNYRYIIIDGAPRLDQMANSAIKCADVVLIPVQPSPWDVWATQDLVVKVKIHQDLAKNKPKAAFVISRKISNTKIGNDVKEALDFYELPIFEQSTYQRVIYPEMAKIGKTVLHGDNAEAKTEIREIAEELKRFI